MHSQHSACLCESLTSARQSGLGVILLYFVHFGMLETYSCFYFIVDLRSIVSFIVELRAVVSFVFPSNSSVHSTIFMEYLPYVRYYSGVQGHKREQNTITFVATME